MQLHSSRQCLRLCSSWNVEHSVECVNKELVSVCAERRLRTAVAGTTPTGYAFNRAIWQGVGSDFGCLGRQIPDSPMIKSIAPGRIRIMANNGETFCICWHAGNAQCWASITAKPCASFWDFSAVSEVRTQNIHTAYSTNQQADRQVIVNTYVLCYNKRMRKELVKNRTGETTEVSHALMHELSPEVRAEVGSAVAVMITQTIEGGETMIAVTPEEIAERGVNDSSKGLATFIDGELVSYASATAPRPRRIDSVPMSEIGSVITKEAYRGRGLARAAMAALVNELADEGVASVVFANGKSEPIARSLGMRDAQLFEVTADMAELCKECNNYCPLNGLKHKDEEPANPARCCDTILTNIDDIVKGSRHGRSYKTC